MPRRSAGEQADRSAPPVSSASRRSSRASSSAGREHLHARRRELDRQRQPIEPAHRSRPPPGPSARDRKIGHDRLRALDKQRHGRHTGCELTITSGRWARLGSRQGWHRHSCSPRTCRRSRVVTSSLKRASSPAVGHQRRGGEHVLEIVEQQQHALVAQELRVRCWSQAAGCPHSRIPSACAIALITRVGSRSGARSTKYAVGKVVDQFRRHMEGQAGLANAPGRQRHEAGGRPAQQLSQRGTCLFAPDQGVRCVAGDVRRGGRRVCCWLTVGIGSASNGLRHIAGEANEVGALLRRNGSASASASARDREGRSSLDLNFRNARRKNSRPAAKLCACQVTRSAMLAQPIAKCEVAVDHPASA